MALEVVRYTDKYQEKWDKFVLEKSVNGTFLQTRRFLNYHPEGRFEDCSLLVMQGSNIVAVVPACDTEDEGKRCFFSHKGSTFGGIVVDAHKYNISTLEELFPALDAYFRENGYERVVFKQTSDLFSTQPADLLDYYYYKNDYQQFDELSFYVDCGKLTDKVEDVFVVSRRRGYRKALKNELQFKQLSSDEEIAAFYHILCTNLEKFGTKPVHTLEELYDFRRNRLTEEVDFYGAYYGDTLVCGTMLFYFGKQVLHTQYLAQDPDYAQLFTMNFLDAKLIELARDKGFSYFSFGISTEERGKVLNKGLAVFKEGFGTDFCVNRTYYKDY